MCCATQRRMCNIFFFFKSVLFVAQRTQVLFIDILWTASFQMGRVCIFCGPSLYTLIYTDNERLTWRAKSLTLSSCRRILQFLSTIRYYCLILKWNSQIYPALFWGLQSLWGLIEKGKWLPPTRLFAVFSSHTFCYSHLPNLLALVPSSTRFLNLGTVDMLGGSVFVEEQGGAVLCIVLYSVGFLASTH